MAPTSDEDSRPPLGAADTDRSSRFAEARKSAKRSKLRAAEHQLVVREIERELAWIESYTAELGCSFGEVLVQEQSESAQP